MLNDPHRNIPLNRLQLSASLNDAAQHFLLSIPKDDTERATNRMLAEILDKASKRISELALSELQHQHRKET